MRGGLAGASWNVLHVVPVSQGEKDIPGLTESHVPGRLGPKSAGRTRTLFHLSVEDNVRQGVVRKPLNRKGQKLGPKPPGVQRAAGSSLPASYSTSRRGAPRKQRTKENKDQAAERAQRLAARRTGARGKRPDQIATSPQAGPSESFHLSVRVQ